MLIYPQGNAIHASPETPYLQIGESKYGKPALDRIIEPEMSLGDAARLSLVSLLDATAGALSLSNDARYARNGKMAYAMPLPSP